MTAFRMFVLALGVIVLAVGPAIAKGGGGGGGGGGGAGGGNGGGHGGDVAAGQSDNDGGSGHSHTVGAGRGTAITAPGSQHRSDTATGRLSAPRPGNANPPSGVTPGFGKVGTVPTTPGHNSP